MCCTTAGRSKRAGFDWFVWLVTAHDRSLPLFSLSLHLSHSLSLYISRRHSGNASWIRLATEPWTHRTAGEARPSPTRPVLQARSGRLSYSEGQISRFSAQHVQFATKHVKAIFTRCSLRKCYQLDDATEIEYFIRQSFTDDKSLLELSARCKLTHETLNRSERLRLYSIDILRGLLKYHRKFVSIFISFLQSWPCYVFRQYVRTSRSVWLCTANKWLDLEVPVLHLYPCWQGTLAQTPIFIQIGNVLEVYFQGKRFE